MSAPAVVHEPAASAARPVRAGAPRRRARLLLLASWAGSLVVLLAFIGRPPVQRTQEARVLETAREMLGQPWRGWLIPQLNGDLRLRKPPLTYWLAAAAYKVGGVNERAGRVPTAIVGWLTLATTFLAAERLFGTRAGFFAAATLLGSYLFFRHDRLAETDAPATLFVTLAVYAILRAAGEGEGGDCGFRISDCGLEERTAFNPQSAIRNPQSEDPHPSPLPAYRAREPNDVPARPSALWLHIAAAASGLAFLSKGGPGIFPVLFLVGYVVVTRRWDVARRFITSGAVFTLICIGASWYAYAAYVVGPKQFVDEMRALSSGEDHGAPFYLYFPQILIATAPWS